MTEKKEKIFLTRITLDDLTKNFYNEVVKMQIKEEEKEFLKRFCEVFDRVVSAYKQVVPQE